MMDNGVGLQHTRPARQPGTLPTPEQRQAPPAAAAASHSPPSALSTTICRCCCCTRRRVEARRPAGLVAPRVAGRNAWTAAAVACIAAVAGVTARYKADVANGPRRREMCGP